MRYTSTSLLLAALAATLQVQADGGFLNPGGCSGFRMGTEGTPGTLQAIGCNGAGDAQVWIDLNTCMANDDGHLVAQKNGGFQGSCDNFITSGSNFYASCEQPHNAGYQPAGSVDLNSIIGYGFYQNNRDQPTLFCFGQTSQYN